MIHTLRKALEATVRQVVDRSPRVVILAYHRVVSVEPDPNQLCVSPKHFEEQVRLLRGEMHLMQLKELGLGRPEADLPKGGVVITFDDGYADNWLNAAPILDGLGIPATFFVTTGMVDTGREFFADELIHLTLLATHLPEQLRVPVGGHTIGLLGEARPIPSTNHAGLGGNGGRLEGVQRERLYGKLHRLLREEDSQSRESILSEIRRQAGEGPWPACESHRTLSSRELRDLAQGDRFEVGAHAVEHLVLRRLPREEQAYQISASKAQLESILSKPVESFAYPYGSEWDVSPTTVELVGRAGFRLACANVPGQVRRGSDPLWLPRHLVRDWGEAEFRGRLRSFFVPRPTAEPVFA